MGNRKKIFVNNADLVVTNYIQRFGNAASLGLLHPDCAFFNDASIDGIIGFRKEGRCAIVIGDPVCALPDRIALADSFNDYCRKLKIKSIYSMASESFTNATLNFFGGAALQFGHEIILDPR